MSDPALFAPCPCPPPPAKSLLLIQTASRTPRMAVMRRNAARRLSTFPMCECLRAPTIALPNLWAMLLPTATTPETPRFIMPGVMKKAPPLPMKPESTPPMKPSSTTTIAVEGESWMNRSAGRSGMTFSLESGAGALLEPDELEHGGSDDAVRPRHERSHGRDQGGRDPLALLVGGAAQGVQHGPLVVEDEVVDDHHRQRRGRELEYLRQGEVHLALELRGRDHRRLDPLRERVRQLARVPRAHGGGLVQEEVAYRHQAVADLRVDGGEELLGAAGDGLGAAGAPLADEGGDRLTVGPVRGGEGLGDVILHAARGRPHPPPP